MVARIRQRICELKSVRLRQRLDDQKAARFRQRICELNSKFLSSVIIPLPGYSSNYATVFCAQLFQWESIFLQVLPHFLWYSCMTIDRVLFRREFRSTTNRTIRVTTIRCI